MTNILNLYGCVCRLLWHFNNKKYTTGHYHLGIFFRSRKIGFLNAKELNFRSQRDKLNQIAIKEEAVNKVWWFQVALQKFLYLSPRPILKLGSLGFRIRQCRCYRNFCTSLLFPLPLTAKALLSADWWWLCARSNSGVSGRKSASVCPSVTVYSADRRAVKISAPFKMLSGNLNNND